MSKCDTCGLTIGGAFGCFGHSKDFKLEEVFEKFDSFQWVYTYQISGIGYCRIADWVAWGGFSESPAINGDPRFWKSKVMEAYFNVVSKKLLDLIAVRIFLENICWEYNGKKWRKIYD